MQLYNSFQIILSQQNTIHSMPIFHASKQCLEQGKHVHKPSACRVLKWIAAPRVQCKRAEFRMINYNSGPSNIQHTQFVTPFFLSIVFLISKENVLY